MLMQHSFGAHLNLISFSPIIPKKSPDGNSLPKTLNTNLAFEPDMPATELMNQPKVINHSTLTILVDSPIFPLCQPLNQINLLYLRRKHENPSMGCLSMGEAERRRPGSPCIAPIMRDVPAPLVNPSIPLTKISVPALLLVSQIPN